MPRKPKIKHLACTQIVSCNRLRVLRCKFLVRNLISLPKPRILQLTWFSFSSFTINFSFLVLINRNGIPDFFESANQTFYRMRLCLDSLTFYSCDLCCLTIAFKRSLSHCFWDIWSGQLLLDIHCLDKFWNYTPTVCLITNCNTKRFTKVALPWLFCE